jgi:hypothetical protein
LTVDSWQWNSILAYFWFLKTFSLNAFILCSFYRLLRFQIPLNPSALTPSSIAVPYCHWGVAPNPTSFFVLTQKRREKRSRLRPFRSKNRRSEGSNRPTCWSSMILW